MSHKRNLDRLEKYVCVNLLKFNKAKSEIQKLGWGNPKHKYSLSSEWTESSPKDKDLDVLVDTELNMTQQCALAAQKSNLHQEKPGQQVKGGDSFPLLQSSCTPPRALHPAVGCPSSGPVGAGLEGATKMIRG
ncbi:hypothetical protein HGM15179_009689 [Zosterops borbonicus]|uniref:Uncharacterized protein n=1 Tax=Zosterops borbonicus TaxID=364589 RepID=A0A8K1LKE9_9PASS|nr:hypothetical protein HGM15179_009689 [Zosterops borbonicus]